MMSKFLDERKYVLMSIKPAYAELIRRGKKTVELRRVLPHIEEDDVIVVYETSPIQRITMLCAVSGVYCCEPFKLWNDVGQQTGIDKESFERYFQGKAIANGIQLESVKLLSRALMLNEVIGTRHAPQSYCYLNEKEIERLRTMDVI